MIKRVILLLLLSSCGLLAQNDSVQISSFKYYDYDVKLTNDTRSFFAGHLEVSKDGKKVFEADSTFSAYEWHKIIDMDGDGSDELLISVSEGMSPYIFNDLYIFDVKKGAKPQYMVVNADIDTSVKGQPKITAFTRMSPALLGLSYSWIMDYKYGKLKFLKAAGSKWAGLVIPDEESVSENLKQYEDFSEKCSDDKYKTFFETILIQYKIAGDEKKGLKFLDKYYKCPDKKKALEQIQNAAADTYSWLNDESNFKYAE